MARTRESRSAWEDSAVNDPPGAHCAPDGAEPAVSRCHPASSFGSGTAVRQDSQRRLAAHGLTRTMSRTRDYYDCEHDGSLLLHGEDRAGRCWFESQSRWRAFRPRRWVGTSFPPCFIPSCWLNARPHTGWTTHSLGPRVTSMTNFPPRWPRFPSQCLTNCSRRRCP